MSITKKIEDLVYAGMVIDDHGKWIPIAEKLKKEKKFLSHLERGEVLTNGKWISIADKDQTPVSSRTTSPAHEPESEVHDETTLDPPESPEETVFLTTEEYRSENVSPADQPPAKPGDSTAIETPEETVSFSAGSIREITADPSDRNDISTAEDFPPETKTMFVDTAPPPETTQTLSEEFEETVLYNIKVLKTISAPPATAAEPPDGKRPPQQPPPPSSAPRITFEEEHLARTGFPRAILMVASVTVVVLIVLLRIFC